MNKTVSYILLVLFLGLCVFARWKCKENLGVKNDQIVFEDGEVLDTSNVLNDYSQYFQLHFRSFRTNENGNFTLFIKNKEGSYGQHLMFQKKGGELISPVVDTKPNSIVCLSSVYVGYLAALGLERNIVGVDNLDYISNEELRNNPNMVEVGNVGQLNIEVLLALNPRYVFVDDFDIKEELEKSLKDAGIMLIKCNPFRERTPLARAEWIKFFGVIFNKYDEAVLLFNDTKFNYHLLKKQAEKFQNKPTVFLNAMWGEQWDVPGGNSFQATLMKDAGANYIFKNDTSSMTLHKGLESVLERAHQADYWLNVGDFNSKHELLKSNANYGQFDAVKNGQLFNNNKGTNPDGGIPYWETSGVYPDWVLKDLLHIFHPNLEPHYKFHYYQKLK